MTVTLRVSELAFIEDCKQKWWWENNYKSSSTSMATYIGIGAHECLQAYFESNRSAHALNARFDLWRNEFRVEMDRVGDQLDAFTIEGMCRTVLDNFLLYEQTNPLEGEVVGVEKRLTRAVDPGADTFDSESLSGMYLSGMIDLLIRRDDGKLWVVDHKILGEWSLSQKPEEILDIDEQLTAYAWLVWKAYGELPGGVIYNILPKRVVTPPDPLKRGGLSKSKSQSTTAELYMQAVLNAGLKLEDYEDIIQYFRDNPAQIVIREQSSRSLRELEMFERRLISRMESVRYMLQEEDFYPSPSIYKCGWCPFVAACKMKMEGSDPSDLLARFGEAEETIFNRHIRLQV